MSFCATTFNCSGIPYLVERQIRWWKEGDTRCGVALREYTRTVPDERNISNTITPSFLLHKGENGKCVGVWTNFGPLQSCE
eukprot:scaffold51807_cov31-Attheya_sp.AAC.2